MKVRANRKLLYRGKIREIGEEFEMDDITARVNAERSWVHFFPEKASEEITGLPPLEPKKKK